MSITGFDTLEIDEILAPVPERQSDAAPELEAPSCVVTAPGDIWELDPVPLVIVNGEGSHPIAPLPRDSGADHRIEAAGQEDDSALHSLMPSLGAPQKNSA